MKRKRRSKHRNDRLPRLVAEARPTGVLDSYSSSLPPCIVTSPLSSHGASLGCWTPLSCQHRRMSLHRTARGRTVIFRDAELRSPCVSPAAGAYERRTVAALILLRSLPQRVFQLCRAHESQRAAPGYRTSQLSGR